MKKIIEIIKQGKQCFILLFYIFPTVVISLFVLLIDIMIKTNGDCERAHLSSETSPDLKWDAEICQVTCAGNEADITYQATLMQHGEMRPIAILTAAGAETPPKLSWTTETKLLIHWPGIHPDQQYKTINGIKVDILE